MVAAGDNSTVAALEELRAQLNQSEERIRELDVGLTETQAELQRARQRERLNEDHSSRLTSTVCVHAFCLVIVIQTVLKFDQTHKSWCCVCLELFKIFIGVSMVSPLDFGSICECRIRFIPFLESTLDCKNLTLKYFVDNSHFIKICL